MLTDRSIRAAKAKAAAYLISDGNGLALKVQKGGARSWILRYMVAGKPHVLGLGSYPEISLSDARRRAQDARRLRADGIDPIEYKRSQRAREAMTFEAAAERYIKAHEAGWRSAKSLAAWQMTLREYTFPVLGTMPVASITAGDVLKVLTPIWSEKPETAGRLRGRIEAVLDYAKVLGQRTGENPAAWRGNLALTLPKRSKVAAVEHHASLPYAELPAFLADLRARDGLAARALEFVILTACRTGEAIGADWSEIDEAGALWRIPGAKGGRDHVAPLSDAAMGVLAGLPRDRAKLFPVSNMAMSMLLRRMKRPDLTVHGFRSTFSTWCAEQTNTPIEVREAALAHVSAEKVAAAYQRGDFLARRRALAERWAAFCAGEESGKVVPLRAAAR